MVETGVEDGNTAIVGVCASSVTTPTVVAGCDICRIRRKKPIAIATINQRANLLLLINARVILSLSYDDEHGKGTAQPSLSRGVTERLNDLGLDGP